MRVTGQPTLTRPLRTLRIVLAALAVTCAVVTAVWGYLGMFTDVLVLRQTPLQTSVSPDARWELRVYEVERSSPYEEHGGLWLATVRRLGQNDGSQHVVYRDSEAVFTWRTRDQLSVREYLLGRERIIDVTSPGPETERWGADEHGLVFIAAFYAFLPSLVILVVGLMLSIYLPGILGRRQVRRSPTSGARTQP